MTDGYHASMTKAMQAKLDAYEQCVKAHECPRVAKPLSSFKCKGGMAAGEFPCNNVNLLSFTPITSLGSEMDASDVWGWTDVEHGGREIAIIGLMDGTSMVDVTVPRRPVVLGFLPSHTYDFVIWRDIKVHDNHAFIGSEAANHGVQIFDLTSLRQYYDVPSGVIVRELKETAFYDEVGSSHNIVINEESARMYVVGSRTCKGGPHVVDISKPAEPQFLGCYDEDGYTHDAQCFVYNGPDKDHVGKEICFNYNEDTLTIVDMTSVTEGKMLSRVEYDNNYYTHQGWLTKDQSYLMLNDELDEQDGPNQNTRTLLWDVTDLSSPRLVASHYADEQSIDHNLYIRGEKAYLANYCSGLRVLDANNMPNSAPELAFFDVAPYCDSVTFEGAWSVYPFFPSGSIALSSIELGLFVLDDVSKPT